MAELVNLNRARKTKARSDAETKAAENRVRFGRTKAERQLDEARAKKARKDIDSGKRER
jgi:hypothetical protein